jgi:site-specific recombinase XerD
VRLPELFAAFVQERRFLVNVTPATLEWYAYSWRAFAPHLPAELGELTEARLKAATVALASNGLAAISVNTHARCLNAFFAWLHAEGHTAARLRIARLKEPALRPATLRPQDIKALLRWTPKSPSARRLQVLLLVILDCGLRISEALGLERSAIDWDQSTLTVLGKGRKQRTVPLSREMRRRLWVYLKTHDHERVFPTRDGRALSPRNVQHGMGRAREALGIPPATKFSPHVLRHTFATSYLRNGGDVFRLQRILGHSTLEMTRRYVSLQTADLTRVHDRFSPLSG